MIHVRIEIARVYLFYIPDGLMADYACDTMAMLCDRVNGVLVQV